MLVWRVDRTLEVTYGQRNIKRALKADFEKDDP